jgi:hypothetical protein
VLQHGLEIGLLAYLLEECKSNLSVIDRDITQSEHCAASFLPLCGAKISCQEAQSAARPPEIGDCTPLLAHHGD